VHAAQGIFRDELTRRGLTEEAAVHHPEAAPDWLEEAAQVLSVAVYTRADPQAVQAGDAQAALRAAGIPCFLEERELLPEPVETVRTAATEVRVLVPGKLNLQATSILDRDLFNQEFEDTWKTHLEMLTDEELREMKPEVVFCGLFDRVERVKRAYREELERRAPPEE
jgi:hypothetical protein